MNAKPQPIGAWGIEVLVPASETSPTTEVSQRLNIGAFAVLTLFAFIVLFAYRSMNPKRWCYWRVIALYATGTFVFVLEQMINGGVSKVTTLGIGLHNMGEWYILSLVWFGSYGPRVMHVWVPLYFFFLFLVTIFLPLPIMFLVAAIQGATLDASLIISFVLVQRKHNDLHLFGFDMRRVQCCCGCNPFTYGFFGAVLHGIGVACFFWGVNSGMVVFTVIGPLLNFPAFIAYMWLAAVMERRLVYFGPRRQLQKASLVFPHTGLSQHADMLADHTVWCGMLNTDLQDEELALDKAAAAANSVAATVADPQADQDKMDNAPDAKAENAGAERPAEILIHSIDNADSTTEAATQLRTQFKPLMSTADQPLTLAERRARLEGPYRVSCFLCILLVGFCISTAFNLAYFFSN